MMCCFCIPFFFLVGPATTNGFGPAQRNHNPPTTMASRTVANVARRAASALTGASRSRLVASAAASNNFAASAPAPHQPHQQRRDATTSAGAALASLAAASPHVDVVRYEHKNVKWTLSHVDQSSEALAVGFIENGLRPGDVVLSWLPQHFGEEHILQFACSKAGLVLYNLDPAQAITDPEGAKKSLARALEVTEANVLVTQEAGNDTNYVKLVESVVPETRMFNFGDGMPFFTPRFPHLRFPIHTGFDIKDKAGMEPLKHMLCPADTLQDQLTAIGAKIDGKTPLMGQLTTGSDGLPQKGTVLSNEDVYKSGEWPTFTSILKKDYVEIEGVGVVF